MSNRLRSKFRRQARIVASDLIAAGCRTDTAWAFAKDMAQARQRYARIVGDRAALAATIVPPGPDERTFRIAVDPKLVPPDQWARPKPSQRLEAVSTKS